MPFLTTPEQIAAERELLKGITIALKIKFGEAGLTLLPELQQQDHKILDAVLDAIPSAETPEKLRKVWENQHGNRTSE